MTDAAANTGADGSAADQGAAPPQDAKGGGDATPWYDSIGDADVKGLMQTKGYDSPDKVAVAYSNLNKLNKGSPHVVAWPNDPKDEKAWGEIYTRLGVPAEAKAYDLKLPEGVAADPKFMDVAKGWFHDAKLPPSAAQKVAESWAKFSTEQQAAAEAAQVEENNKAIAEYKAKVGPDWDASVVRGQRAAKALGLDPGALDKLDKALGVPAVLNLLATLGRKIGTEDKFIEGVNREGFGKTKEEAGLEVARLRADKGFTDSLMDPRHPLHAANTQKWQELQRVAFAK